MVTEKSLLSLADAQSLFGPVLRIKAVHESFLEALSARTQNGTELEVPICDLLQQFVRSRTAVTCGYTTDDCRYCRPTAATASQRRTSESAWLCCDQSTETSRPLWKNGQQEHQQGASPLKQWCWDLKGGSQSTASSLRYVRACHCDHLWLRETKHAVGFPIHC